jgi:hypothetical protein
MFLIYEFYSITMKFVLCRLKFVYFISVYFSMYYTKMHLGCCARMMKNNIWSKMSLIYL